ncbi:uncharacterized protein hhla2b.1 [Lampris incognitus]|uniref:uncharacterized protein hhla2b.1 n=1 Tax=Lampris incognitus TaxID=2546036 RepID=UPI0024B4B37D|nr:uncharacterized protein hhla2b.1 [Lampris incognitus]
MTSVQMSRCAPIGSLTLELTRLSGYEEMKCTTRNVYPAPHVVWATDPPNSEVLRPITRKLADRRGLYTVESRLRRMKARAELIYICKVTSAYGTQTRTASLTERELSGLGGRDLTIPCHAPPYLHNPSLSWSFSSGNEPTLILTYDSLSQHSFASPPWRGRALLDMLGVSAGDGSLQLLNADHVKHTGVYTCVYSAQHNTHTEHTEVLISAAGERLHPWEPSHWWIIALVIALLVVALVGMLVYLKIKGSHSKPRKCPEEATELQSVKDKTEGSNLTETNPLAVENTR